jgi:hypothetical protein
MNAPRPQLQKRLDEGQGIGLAHFSSRMMIKIKFSSFVKLHRRQPEIRIRFGCGGKKSRGRRRHAGRHVTRQACAHPPGRLHRALPPNQNDTLPSGSQWLHEIKHDGFRVTGSAFYRLALACGEARPS